MIGELVKDGMSKRPVSGPATKALKFEFEVVFRKCFARHRHWTYKYGGANEPRCYPFMKERDAGEGMLKKIKIKQLLRRKKSVVRMIAQ